jgi:hypothetical protein
MHAIRIEQAESEEDFVRAHPYLFLLVREASRPTTKDTSQAYRTQALSPTSIRAMLAAPRPAPLAFPARKDGDGDSPSLLTIGRADSNDIVLAYAEISKLHAIIRDEGPGGYTITDANSNNGTWLNEQRLTVAWNVLRVGDSIHLAGVVTAVLADAATVYRALCKQW